MNREIACGVLFLSVVVSLPAGAQTTVYESKDAAGPVFSDSPAPGAKAVEVAPMNQSQGIAAQPPARATPAAPGYSTLTITAPATEDTIHTNTGEFDVAVQVEPPLRTAAGDRIRLRLDGTPLPAAYRGAKLRISANDWSRAARTDDVAHTLTAAIVDRRGAVLLESSAVTFYVHRATRDSRRR